MKLLLTGCTGFIGRELIPLLIKEGHKLTVISRQYQGELKAIANERSISVITMNPAESSSWNKEEIQNSLKSCEGVINLAGEPIAEKRWTENHCKEIMKLLLTGCTGFIGRELIPLLIKEGHSICLLYTSPSPRDRQKSRMPSSA